MSWDEAMAGADTCSIGGYTDWRLPSIKELYSLILFSGTDPSGPDPTNLIPFIDVDYFEFEYGDTLSGERLIDAQFCVVVNHEFFQNADVNSVHAFENIKICVSSAVYCSCCGGKQSGECDLQSMEPRILYVSQKQFQSDILCGFVSIKYNHRFFQLVLYSRSFKVCS